MNTSGYAHRRVAILLDVGNTRIKAGWSCLDTTERETVPLAIPHSQTDRLVTWLDEQGVLAVRALGTNVAGVDTATRIQQALSCAQCPPAQWLSGMDYASELNVVNNYQEPEKLGADRWAAMLGLAAHAEDHTTPLLLASFGTATTVDVLCPTPSGWQFAGGLILPGAELMRQALATQTADLPSAHGTVVDFPRDTHQAIISGITAAQAGAVARQWQATLRQFRLAPIVFCTGGNWLLVADEVQTQLQTLQTQHGLQRPPARTLVAPVLDGLARVAQLARVRARD
ncbi:MAG TPA: type III pantothenate kinase [Burkholderiaceae bacterium]|nr:type III pantothenate kinase [Burkholderiaceae bacterium]